MVEIDDLMLVEGGCLSLVKGGSSMLGSSSPVEGDRSIFDSLALVVGGNSSLVEGGSSSLVGGSSSPVEGGSSSLVEGGIVHH